jgi:hypothetical protein
LVQGSRVGFQELELGGVLQKEMLVKFRSGHVIAIFLQTQREAQDLDRSVRNEWMQGYMNWLDS